LPNCTVFWLTEQHWDLPDPQDRHVVAAAIEANASLILTWNLRDFPTATLRAHGLTCQTPDAFFVALFDQMQGLVVASLANARCHLSRSGVSAQEFLEIRAAHGLIRLAQRLRRCVGDL
jgi:hypothetical protein